MKKALLIIGCLTTIVSAKAQLTLSGTSYTQNFDSLTLYGGSVAYPTGWVTYNHATATSLGTVEAIQYYGKSIPSTYFGDSAACIGTVRVGGFKNFPSGDVLTLSDDMCDTAHYVQPSNRALGVRQVDSANGSHPKLDPGAAFVLKIANTTGRKNFALTFKLQSLDTTSSRTTTWTLDYGIGSSPTSFTPVAPTSGAMTTGGHIFSNNTITASFGNALDEKTGPVYIRIAALSYSSGGGNRASSAIDDFNLTYTLTTGVPEIVAPQISLAVLGSAASNKVTFGCDAQEAADYSFMIYDLAGRVLHSQTMKTQIGGQHFVVSDLNLAPGMYFAKMSNNNSSTVAKFIVQ